MPIMIPPNLITSQDSQFALGCIAIAILAVISFVVGWVLGAEHATSKESDDWAMWHRGGI